MSFIQDVAQFGLYLLGVCYLLLMVSIVLVMVNYYIGRVIINRMSKNQDSKTQMCLVQSLEEDNDSQ